MDDELKEWIEKKNMNERIIRLKKRKWKSKDRQSRDRDGQ